MEELLNAIANSSVMQQMSLLPQALQYGELGIDFLIECLNDTELEIRATAYNLLQDVDLAKAKNAISPGLLLNPGDKIYSVYQAGIYYTDRILSVLWDYVDYLQQLHHQLESNQKYLYPEHSQRTYCYTNKQQAEATTEALHLKIIQETDIYFEWGRKNPNFDPKQWCLGHNLPYKSEWDSWGNYEVSWAIKDTIWMDDELSNNFRRSRYIYHPKHIDTWCDDNSVEYDRSLDNWDNYEKVMDYLHLPENIE